MPLTVFRFIPRSSCRIADNSSHIPEATESCTVAVSHNRTLPLASVAMQPSTRLDSHSRSAVEFLPGIRSAVAVRPLGGAFAFATPVDSIVAVAE